MKIRLLKFPQLFARKSKKTLRLSTSRRASASGADFEEMPEPNMKLSRALLIVLLLHVVAVGGILAFNAIKSRQEPLAPARATTPQPSPSPAPAAVPERARLATTPAHSPPARAEKKSPADGLRTYTVVKGDTPLTIAKKFKVPYDELVAANHIEDPRKLKIGQKLIIPAKTAAKPRKGGTD